MNALRCVVSVMVPLCALVACDREDEEAPRQDPDFALCDDAVAADDFSDPLFVPPLAGASLTNDGALHYELAATSSTHAFKGCSTLRADTLGYSGSEYLGPTIRLTRGKLTEVTVYNGLTEPTSVHWHGLKTSSNVDITGAHLPAGQSATVRFTPDQPAATLWIHPHEHMRTGEQIFRGLASVVIIDDGLQPTLPHTYGVDDIPLVVQDRRFTPDGKLDYLTYDEDTDGMLGNRIAVNGGIHPSKDVPRGLVRFRLLNFSSARFYDFALDNGQSFFQIASDGGLLAAPNQLTHLVLAPAERAEIVIDFTKVTAPIRLVTLAYDSPGGRTQMASIPPDPTKPTSIHVQDGDDKSKTPSGKPTADPARRPDNGEAFDIMELRVSDALPASPTKTLPAALATLPAAEPAAAVNASAPRQFLLEDTGDDVINGQLFDENRIDQHVKQGTSEVWLVKNDATDLAHPFHVHGGQFRVLSRSSSAVAPGELGYKDTVTVLPGEEVRILVDFTTLLPGNFFFHCHILEHEDMGMMGIFAVDPK